MLNALVRDRDTIGPDRSIDIRFDDFMANEIGVAERVYALAGEPFTEPERGAVADYLVATSAAGSAASKRPARCSGCEEDDLRSRFAPYVERFLKA